jgi:GrpB-like predicted nucleotidyltransferase (UPF0157 family)
MSRIELVPYDKRWPGAFQRIAADIRHALGGLALRIDHVGSTAIPDLAAKDVIDVQVTVALLDPEPLITAFGRIGYICTAPDGRDHVPPGGSERDDADWRKLFLVPSEGRRVHVHVRVAGAANQRYALLFRDYLRTHPAAAAAYADLKRKLATLDPPLDMRAYADVKDPACDIVIAAAEDWADLVSWTPGPTDG